MKKNPSLTKDKFTIDGDVHADIPFYCMIGNLETYISIQIEPSVGGDTDFAHMHNSVMCHKGIDWGGDDTTFCRIINTTCPFMYPFSSGKIRVKEYVFCLFQITAKFEFYGKKRLSDYFSEKYGGPKTEYLENLNLFNITKLLYELNLIDNQTYDIMNEVRKERNSLAHANTDPDILNKFNENKVIQLIREGNSCVTELSESRI